MALSTIEYTVVARDQLGSALTDHRHSSSDPADISWFVDLTTLAGRQPCVRFRTFDAWCQDEENGVCVEIDSHQDFERLISDLSAGGRLFWNRKTDPLSNTHVFIDRGGHLELLK